MNRIVLDLEFTKVMDKEVRLICKEEIIQIGAVKLNEEGTVIDRFDELIKPTYTKIWNNIQNLTHITNEMVEDKEDFSTVLEHFLDWIGEDDYHIYTWSDSDLKVMKGELQLIHCADERADRMIANWVDAQAIICEIIGIHQALSLKNALAATDDSFDGQEHSAIYDAENTAKLVALIDDKEKLKSVMAPILELFAPKEELTTSLGSLFEGLNLND